MRIWHFSVPIVESVLGLAVGAVAGVLSAIFIPASPFVGWAFSLAAPVVGVMLTIQRRSLEESVRQEREAISSDITQSLLPLRSVAEYIDIGPDSDYSSLSEVVRRFAVITEPEFSPVKQRIIKDAADQLRSLAVYKRSPTLQASDYYDWIFRQLGTLKSGDYVHAVSMSSDEEWNDSDLERNFLRANVDAAQRGVRIERIFVVESSRIANFVKLPPIDAHTLESDVPLLGYWVKKEQVLAQDPSLLKRVGEGFIDFNARVGLEDRFDPRGEARGDVTMLDIDLARMNDIYDKLLKMSTPLLRNNSAT